MADTSAAEPPPVPPTPNVHTRITVSKLSKCYKILLYQKVVHSILGNTQKWPIEPVILTLGMGIFDNENGQTLFLDFDYYHGR